MKPAPPPSDPSELREEVPVDDRPWVQFSQAIEVPKGDKLVPTTRFRIDRLRIGHLRGAPTAAIAVGDVVTIGALMAGITSSDLTESWSVIRSRVRKILSPVPANEIQPLVGAVEQGLAVYQKSAEAFENPGRVAECPSWVVNLQHPVRFGKDTVESLTLRALTAGDLWDSPSGSGLSIYETAQLGGRQAGVSSSVIDALGMEDAGALNAVVTGFLLGFQATGTKRSAS